MYFFAGMRLGALAALSCLYLQMSTGASPVLQSIVFDTQQVDVTAGGQEIVIDMSITSGGGFFDGVVRFRSQDNRSVYDLSFDQSHLVSGDYNSGQYRLEFGFPQFAEQGFWDLELQLQDLNSGQVTYGPDDSQANFPSGSPLGISVTNSGYEDLLSPSLFALSNPPSTVVLSATQATPVDLTLDIVDDGIGIWAAFVRIYGSNGQWEGSTIIEPFLQTGNSPSSYHTTVTLPPGFPAGPLFMTVTLEDHFGHRRVMNSSPYFTSTGSELFPPNVDAFMLARYPGDVVDEEAPVINDANLSTTSVDTTGKGSSVVMTIDYTEGAQSGVTAAGVRDAQFTLVGPGGQTLSIPSSFRRISGSPTAGVLEATLVIPPYTPPGLWEGVVEIWDHKFNNRKYGGFPTLEIPGSGWQLDLQVENHGPVDTVAPVFTDAYFDTRIANVANQSVDFAVMLRVSDEGVGFSSGSVELVGSISGPLQIDGTFDSLGRIEGTGRDGLYRFEATVPAFTPPQVLRIDEVTIQDGAGNAAVFLAGDDMFPIPPNSQGFAELKIRNTGAQELDPPSLELFQASSATVNVSSAAAPVVFTFGVDDDASGVAGGTVFFGDYAYGFDASHLTAGDANSGTYELPVTIPQGAEPGQNLLFVSVFDGAENVRIYFPGTFPSGAPSMFEIINTGAQDLAGPMMSAISATAVVDIDNGDELVIDLTASDFPAGGIRGSVRVGGVEIGFDEGELTAGTADNGTFQIAVPFPVELAAGDYDVEIVLSDALDNDMEYGGTNAPYPGGYAGTVTILNSFVKTLPEPEVIEYFMTPSAEPTLSFFTHGSADYVVEWAALPEGPWTPLFAPTAGIDGELMILDRDAPISLAPRRFHRVLQITAD